jgi:hypothetical protein
LGAGSSAAALGDGVAGVAGGTVVAGAVVAGLVVGGLVVGEAGGVVVAVVGGLVVAGGVVAGRAGGGVVGGRVVFVGVGDGWRTTMLPCIEGCTLQWYANVPAVPKTRENVWSASPQPAPALVQPGGSSKPVPVTEWGPPVQHHVTVVPGATFSVAGV